MGNIISQNWISKVKNTQISIQEIGEMIKVLPFKNTKQWIVKDGSVEELTTPLYTDIPNLQLHVEQFPPKT